MKLTASYSTLRVRIADEPLRRMPDYPGPLDGPAPDPVGELLRKRRRKKLNRKHKKSHPIPHSESLNRPYAIAFASKGKRKAFEDYLAGALGSLPHNLIISALQAVGEAVADTVRVGVEAIKVPGKLKRRDTDPFGGPIEAAVGGIWNLVKNVARPFYRSHQTGNEKYELSEALSDTIGQMRDRLALLGKSLSPEEKQELKANVEGAIQTALPGKPQADQLAQHLVGGVA